MTVDEPKGEVQIMSMDRSNEEVQTTISGQMEID